MIKYTSIRIDMINRDRLKHYGEKGETYDDILDRLMNFYDEEKEKIKND